MPDCQSGAVHSLVCGTISYSAVAGDIGVCHADCHEGNCRKAQCDEAAAVVGAPVSFMEKETGERFVQNVGRAGSLLQG